MRLPGRGTVPPRLAGPAAAFRGRRRQAAGVPVLTRARHKVGGMARLERAVSLAEHAGRRSL